MLEIKCPSCSHIMDFDRKSGMLSCGSCGTKLHITKVDMPEYGSYKNSSYLKKYILRAEEPEDSRTEGGGMENADIKPADVREISFRVPFEVSKDDAVKELRLWGGRKLFSHNAFNAALKAGDIDMEYYPAFLFKVSAFGKLRAVCTKNEDDLSSETTRTHYYDVEKNYDMPCAEMLLSASGAVSDMVLEGLLPYDYSKLAEYDAKDGGAGYKITKKSSLLYRSVRSRITERISDILWDSLKEYSSKHNSDTSVNVYGLDISAILVPAWHLRYERGNAARHIYMNGTNKVIYGERPVSVLKIILCSAISGLLLFLIAALAIIFI